MRQRSLLRPAGRHAGKVVILSNATDYAVVLRKDLIVDAHDDLTVDNADYAADSRLRYNINRNVGDNTGDLTAAGTPVGFPDETTDPPEETRPRLRPAFQVKRR